MTNHNRYEAETSRLLSHNQADFLSECNTEYQLLRLSNSITDGFQCSPMKRTVLTINDYKRAYDRTWRDALLVKMLRKGASSHMIRWIRVWLVNRQRWITFEGAKSKKTILKQGNPEGSLLSLPLLTFSIDDLRWGSGTNSFACCWRVRTEIVSSLQGPRLHQETEERPPPWPQALASQDRQSTRYCLSEMRYGGGMGEW